VESDKHRVDTERKSVRKSARAKGERARARERQRAGDTEGESARERETLYLSHSLAGAGAVSRESARETQMPQRHFDAHAQSRDSTSVSASLFIRNTDASEAFDAHALGCLWG
jgi:hypothetical protein